MPISSMEKVRLGMYVILESPLYTHLQRDKLEKGSIFKVCKMENERTWLEYIDVNIEGFEANITNGYLLEYFSILDNERSMVYEL